MDKNLTFRIVCSPNFWVKRWIEWSVELLGRQLRHLKLHCGWNCSCLLKVTQSTCLLKCNNSSIAFQNPQNHIWYWKSSPKSLILQDSKWKIFEFSRQKSTKKFHFAIFQPWIWIFAPKNQHFIEGFVILNWLEGKKVNSLELHEKLKIHSAKMAYSCLKVLIPIMINSRCLH